MRVLRVEIPCEHVVELIFGEGLHDQVVRRCVDVLVFLANRGAFDVRQLELVWRASLDKHSCHSPRNVG